MKGIPAWLFLGGIWRNGRRLEWQEWRSTRDMTHKPLFPGFLNSYLSWPPKAVKTNCKTGRLLNIYWCLILFCILNGGEIADRVDKVLDQTLSHFLVSFPLSTSCWDLMWSQLTTPCLWLMARKSPGVHVCANPKCRINALRTEPHPMGEGYSWIKALPLSYGWPWDSGCIACWTVLWRPTWRCLFVLALFPPTLLSSSSPPSQ